MKPGAPKLMLVIAVLTGVLVAGVIALATRSWAVLGVLLLIHFIATAVVVGYSLRGAAEDEDKPDPVTQARLEEERARG